VEQSSLSIQGSISEILQGLDLDLDTTQHDLDH
jgi:hypothetical protein